MGRYSFMGSYQNLSETEVNRLHANVNQGRCLISTNIFQDIQSMRDKRYLKQRNVGAIARKAIAKQRPGNLSGYWFK